MLLKNKKPSNEKLKEELEGNDKPFVSEMRIIQEDDSGAVIDLGNGFRATVVYRAS